MPKDEPTALDDIAALALAAIIQRSANESVRDRRTPDRMRQHVDDAYEYARLVMCRREKP